MDKSLLTQVVLDQAVTKAPRQLVPRWQYKQVLPLVKNKQVIIISGIRRCGKSTLMHMIRTQMNGSNYYLNFDDDRLVQFQLADFQLLLEVFIELYGKQNTFYFDEIQNIANWERFVRRLHNEGSKVFITGSNASLLSSELGTHLTGRYISVRLFPYSFKEFVSYKEPSLLTAKSYNTVQTALINKCFNEFKQTGGMPEYVDSRQQEYLHALYESILYKDIIVRNKLSQPNAIKELVYYLASNNAKKFSYNSMRKLLGLASANTVAEYCGYLQNSFLCFTLNRFSYSLKKQIHYAKKNYFIDQALAASVGFRISEDYGRTLENIVFLQMMRMRMQCYFHKEKKECDFVIRDGYDVAQALQVSSCLKDPGTKSREIKGLVEAMESYSLTSGTIITESEFGTEQINHNGASYTINVIPCWRWLLDIEC